MATAGSRGLVARVGPPAATKEVAGPGVGGIIKIKGKHISSSFDNTAGGGKYSLQAKSTGAPDAQVADQVGKLQQRIPGK